MMKLALMRTATGKEDLALPLLQRICSLELPASEIAACVVPTMKHGGGCVMVWGCTLLVTLSVIYL